VAKIYGDRYENLGQSVGGGGQSDVFRVRDTLDPLKTEYALKRLKNAARYERFLNEIEALRSITHPNVIKIVDHSGEAQPGDTKHKYWFVMPLADGNLQQRVGLYKVNMDAVLRVAIQLADALATAHAKDIIHRDVKPANILFPRLDHEAWLADFGICHLGAAKERLTQDGEVVGARSFIAPELEAGGQLPVTGAADIYSLGKVIYYMLSGGGLIAREELNSAEFAATFAKGEQRGQLRTLLWRMIAPIERRMDSAAEARDALRRIEQWDQHALTLALSPDALASIDALQRRAADRIRVTEDNHRIQTSQREFVNSVTANIADWLPSRTDKDGRLAASYIRGGGWSRRREHQLSRRYRPSIREKRPADVYCEGRLADFLHRQVRNLQAEVHPEIPHLRRRRRQDWYRQPCQSPDAFRPAHGRHSLHRRD
jgi:serine/threonine protein kinase